MNEQRYLENWRVFHGNIFGLWQRLLNMLSLAGSRCDGCFLERKCHCHVRMPKKGLHASAKRLVVSPARMHHRDDTTQFGRSPLEWYLTEREVEK